MSNHSTGRRLLAAGILLAATAAHADSSHLMSTDRVEYRADGTVHLGGQVFANREAYYRSPAFRESGARCGNHDHVPSAAALIAQSDCAMNKTMINPDYSDNRTLVIQVVFHVIQRTDGRGAISPTLIQSQMDILNEDFNALAGTPGSMGSNTQLQFVLAKFDPQGNPTTGINVVTNNQYFNDPGTDGGNPMKRAINWDPTRYLNIYTNDAAGLLGYATFPAEDNPGDPYDGAGGAEDGVVLLWDAVGRNAPGGAPYNQGRTATHEIGHYLGLYHTFQGGCGSAAQPYSTGDLIADTQSHSGPQFDCPIQASTCGGGNAPAENYMNYTDDTCMTKFTVEQVNRMRCSIVNYRTVNTSPVAAFTVSTSKLDATFTNTSSDAESPASELHHKWTFGDGETSTEANPSHTYAADGTYHVTLEVVDPGSGTTTKTESVSVTATPVTPDAGPNAGPDGGTGGTEDGGGCCQAPGGELSALLCGLPVLLVLGRRRRRAHR